MPATTTDQPKSIKKLIALAIAYAAWLAAATFPLKKPAIVENDTSASNTSLPAESTPSPIVHISETPAPEATPAPIVHISETPAPEATATPEPEVRKAISLAQAGLDGLDDDSIKRILRHDDYMKLAKDIVNGDNDGAVIDQSIKRLGAFFDDNGHDLNYGPETVLMKNNLIDLEKEKFTPNLVYSPDKNELEVIGNIKHLSDKEFFDYIYNNESWARQFEIGELRAFNNRALQLEIEYREATPEQVKIFRHMVRDVINAKLKIYEDAHKSSFNTPENIPSPSANIAEAGFEKVFAPNLDLAI